MIGIEITPRYRSFDPLYSRYASIFSRGASASSHDRCFSRANTEFTDPSPTEPSCDPSLLTLLTRCSSSAPIGSSNLRSKEELATSGS
eukprot:372478-Rhodomonas_salina.1